MGSASVHPIAKEPTWTIHRNPSAQPWRELLLSAQGWAGSGAGAPLLTSICHPSLEQGCTTFPAPWRGWDSLQQLSGAGWKILENLEMQMYNLDLGLELAASVILPLRYETSASSPRFYN